MDEKLFSEMVTVSAAIAEQSKVSALRENSINILEEIKSFKQGVFLVAGLRGTGKTTLLAALYEKEKDTLFINAEIVLKHGIGLLDILHYSHAKGYTTILLDEVHVLPNWEKDIKIFYDETRKKIILSGSSAIALRAKGSELSRRARTFRIRPFSFREYLMFQTKKQFSVITLKDIITPEKRKLLMKNLTAYHHYMAPFSQFDALPSAYFEKNPETYINILERTIRYDLVSLRQIDAQYMENAFRAVKIIASSSPGELSYSGLSNALGIGIKLVKEIISALHQTGIVQLVPPFGIGKKAVRKEEKIIMPLSFRAALCSHYNLPTPIGGVREDFFVHHVGQCTYFKTGKERRTPDFVVEDFIFEVGGASKGLQQITGMKNAYVVKEGFPSQANELPLMLFGFLY